MDHEVMRTGLEVEHFGVGHDLRLWQDLPPGLGKARHDGRRRKRSVNLVQSLLDLGGRFPVQEQFDAAARGSRALAGEGCTVGQGWGMRRRHGGGH